MKKILLFGDKKAFDSFKQSKLQEHGSNLRFNTFGNPLKVIVPMSFEYIWYEKITHIDFRGYVFDSIIILSYQESLFEKLESILQRVLGLGSNIYFKALKIIYDEQESLRKKQVKRLVNLSKPKKEPKVTKRIKKEK